ncbi:MAG TPA: 3-beta hydroxysteroid dehydrogenase [Trebonia sp.]|nr:3-beta hydroxysteroid dehydrogenase [Trebonia sp.]
MSSRPDRGGCAGAPRFPRRHRQPPRWRGRRGRVIHLAFKHDFGDFAAAGAADLNAVQAMGDVLAGSGRPLVIASGTLMLAMIAPGRPGTEDIVAGPELAAAPRVASELAVLAMPDRGARTSIVRLSPTVHGDGDRGFVPRLIDIARDKGVAAYVGDGANRWPAVHRLDAARLFRLALEKAPAGSVLHAAGDPGIPFTEIAGAIGGQLGIPATSISAEEADGHFGFLGAFVQLDNPTSTELTGWQPAHPGLIADLEEGHYFAAGSYSKY